MSVSDPQHICNVLSDEELQMLCAQPEGSEQWFREEASTCFGCSPDQFPQEMIDCWRDLWVHKKLGRNQYHLEQTTCRGVTHDVEGRQSGAEAAQGRAGA
jgi:hypothetical protein